MRPRSALLVVLVWAVSTPHAAAHKVPPPAERPYRWVVPPPGIDRPPPQGIAATVELTPEGSAPATVTTPDLQARLILSASAFGAHRSDRAVEVRIEPVDPAARAEPPRGLEPDGNAYVVEASYVPSGEPADLSDPVTLSLRYPSHAHRVLVLDEPTWRPIQATEFSNQRVIVGVAPRLGVFVAAAPPDGADETGPPGWLLPVSGAAVLAALFGLDRVARRRARA